MGTNTNCVICGLEFTPVRRGHKICSDRCRHQARGYGYRQARQEALYRDAYACTECGATDALECHHKTPVSEGGDNSLPNLTILCRVCHKLVHRIMRSNAYGRRIRGGGEGHAIAA